MSSSFNRSTSHSLSCTDMNESGIAALLCIAMSNNAVLPTVPALFSSKKISSFKKSTPTTPSLSLHHLPAEELTVDTATAAAAAVAATTEVSTVG